MYQIIGLSRALSSFGALCAVFFVVWVVASPLNEPASLLEWWKVASSASAAAAMLVTLAGQTPIFPWLCRLPVVRGWLPPIDGTWEATIESNWPEIQQRLAVDSQTEKASPTKATVMIKARLLFIHLSLISDNRYSTSETVFVQASRDPESGSIQLNYIYRNSTKMPLITDSDGHDGAARLTIEDSGDNMWLDGVYWTNRNWHKGLNTAGRITFRRVSHRRVRQRH